MAKERKDGPSLMWQGVDLPRVPPGSYQAVCIDWQGPEWVRAYRRWSLRLEFSLISGEGSVSAFFNLGNNPERWDIGRRSRFYAAWSQANGETPRKGQQMSLEAFTDPSLIYTVRVDDVVKDGKDEAKPDALIYSRVTEILKIERP